MLFLSFHQHYCLIAVVEEFEALSRIVFADLFVENAVEHIISSILFLSLFISRYTPVFCSWEI